MPYGLSQRLQTRCQQQASRANHSVALAPWDRFLAGWEAEQANPEAIARQQALVVEADRALPAAAQSDLLRQPAEKEKQELRARLLQQLNTVLSTRDSARGLIPNMSDVWFNSGSFDEPPRVSVWPKFPALCWRIRACIWRWKGIPTAWAATNTIDNFRNAGLGNFSGRDRSQLLQED